MYLVVADVSLWTATVTIDPRTEFHLEQRMPPRDLVSGGVMAVLDKAILTAFETMRSKARRLCLAAGPGFAGGNLIAPHKAGPLHEELEKIQAEFERRRDTVLIPALPFLYAAWESKHPLYADLLRSRRPPAGVVQARLRFKFGFTQLSAPDTQDESIAESFRQMCGEAFPALVDEVAQRSREIHRRSFCVDDNSNALKTSVRQTAITSIRDLLEKIDDFACFDPRARPMVQLIQRTLATLPTRGPITGPDLIAAVNLLRALQNADTLITDALSMVAPAPQSGLFDPLEESEGSEDSEESADEATAIPAVSERLKAPDTAALSLV